MLFISISNDDFIFIRWIITELCKETLQEWIERNYKEPDQMVALNERKILYQVTDGLTCLHRLRIVHRDIKPTNILISLTGEQTKLADFGISRALTANQGDFTNSSWSNPHGTMGWMAPELYHNERYDFKVDIFPLGCIFGYTLSKQKQHPFGNDPLERSVQIKKKLGHEDKCLNMEGLKDPYSNHSTLELIKSMLQMEPDLRPTAEQILNHNFFTNCDLIMTRAPTEDDLNNIVDNITEHQQLQGISIIFSCL